MESKNKIALVTGANKGIGFEIAKKLGAAGCTVILGARNEKLGQEACEKLKATGAKVEYLNLDLLNPDSIENAAKAIDQKHGRLDILVNNAGILEQSDGSPTKTDVDSVEASCVQISLGRCVSRKPSHPCLKNPRKVQSSMSPVRLDLVLSTVIEAHHTPIQSISVTQPRRPHSI